MIVKVNVTLHPSAEGIKLLRKTKLLKMMASLLLTMI
jgi:hypothetical protein